ncbi:MAG: pyruvate dehydrogenase complex E1 component subunit beta [Calditrichaeota bacterium]|nr:pyruvate dehydrogenase complex E1 component subunit beta [Calditrichota bacterium]
MAEKSFREALRDAMTEEMERDKSVFLMGEEVAQYNGAYKVSQGMLDHFGPERVIDTPITEAGFAGLGIGAAMTGTRPIVEFMTWNFALLAADQIINHAAKMCYMSGGEFNVPIVFRGCNGYATWVGSQHSQSFEGLYSKYPGLKVAIPSNPYDAKGLLKTAIRDNDPVIFLESEMMYGNTQDVPDEEYLIPFGQADIKRAGTDVTVVAWSKMLWRVMEVADKLQSEENISVEVIDPRTIRPFDEATIIESVKKTNRLVIVEEDYPFASVGSEISYLIQDRAFDYLDAPVMKVNSLDVNLAYSKPLEAETMPTEKRIKDAIFKVLYKD